MVNGTDDGELFGLLGHQRDVLARAVARGGGLNGSEGATYFSGSSHFGIKRLMMTHPTPAIDDDTVFRLPTTRPSSQRGRCRLLHA